MQSSARAIDVGYVMNNALFFYLTRISPLGAYILSHTTNSQVFWVYASVKYLRITQKTWRCLTQYLVSKSFENRVPKQMF